MSNRHDDDKAVGYRNPPVWGQFQKGKSGNPKGRPRKKEEAKPPPSSELDDLLKEVFDQTVAIKEDGQTKKIRVTAVIAKRMVSDAVKGNHHAQRESLKLARLVEENEARRAAATAKEEAEKRAQEDKDRRLIFDYLCDLKRSQTAKWEEALAAGLHEPADPWPHPDDIILNKAGDGFHVRGPITEECLEIWEELRRIRDLFLIEMALALATDARQSLVNLWLALTTKQDLELPKRWQMSHDLDPAIFPLVSMPLPKLRKLAEDERAWLESRAPNTPRTKEQYREANRMIGPIVKALGYKSLKHFERSQEGDSKVGVEMHKQA